MLIVDHQKKRNDNNNYFYFYFCLFLRHFWVPIEIYSTVVYLYYSNISPVKSDLILIKTWGLPVLRAGFLNYFNMII